MRFKCEAPLRVASLIVSVGLTNVQNYPCSNKIKIPEYFAVNQIAINLCKSIGGIVLSIAIGIIVLFGCFWFDTDVLGHTDGFTGGIIGYCVGGLITIVGSIASLIWPWIKK